jgi:peptidase C10-like protein/Spi protease inhibitor
MNKKNLREKSMAFGIIVLFLGAGVVSGINGNETFGAEFDQKQQQIGIKSATKVANIKLSQLGKTDDFSVGSSIESYLSCENIILFYVFDLQPQGYIVVSADSNLPPVIAYSFTDNFQSDVSKDNILLQMLKADIELRLENVEKLPENIIKSRNVVWSEFLSEETEVSVNIDFEQWPPEGTTPTEGWIETKWHQNSPYNDFCPMDGDERSIAGCPAVAMAQILNYHKTTNNVAFNDSDDYYHSYGNRFWIDNDHEEYNFPSFPELNDYLDTLAYHYDNQLSITDEDKATLNFACGVAATQVYTSGGSGTFGVNQAYDAYLKFDCNTVELLDNSDTNLYDRLSQNIKDALPTHLAVVTPGWDAGHNLVIDGYNTDEYYHLNFGWGGSYDAWYLLPDELPYDLTVIEGIIVDIMNNDAGPDLDCNGALSWVDIKPGDVVTGSFTVENIGDPASELDWEIESHPEWGTWTFTPLNGDDLTPEDGAITVEVSVVAPDKKNKEFDGGIKIVNREASGDQCYIQVSLATPRIKDTGQSLFQFLERLIQRFPLLECLLDLQ